MVVRPRIPAVKISPRRAKRPVFSFRLKIIFSNENVLNRAFPPSSDKTLLSQVKTMGAGASPCWHKNCSVVGVSALQNLTKDKEREIMKKMSIMIAVSVVMAAAATVRAEELKMDFDKGSFSSEKFMEAVKMQEPSANGIPSRAFSVEYGNTGDPSNDLAILATIKRCENGKVDETLQDDLKKLLIYGTAEEKAQFNTPEKYAFPQRLNAFPSAGSFDQLAARNKSLGNCVKWASKDVCRDKEIWQTTCLAGTVWCFVAAGGSCGPAGAVCTLVNRIVSECVSVPYCVEWDSEAVPGFGNPGVV